MPIIQPRRRVGLSSNAKPQPLLSMVNNREVRADTMKSTTMKPRDPESLDALPLGSSDEEEDYRQLKDSDDDDKQSQRVDIKPTTFRNSQQNSPQRSNTQRNTRESAKQSLQEKKVIKNSQSDEPSSSAGSKRSADDLGPESSSYLTNVYGFTSSQSSFKKTKSSNRRPTTYGASSSQPKSSQPKSLQKSAPRSSAKRPNLSDQSSKRKLKEHAETPSPRHRRNPAPEQGFIQPEIISSPEKVDYSTAFKMPSLDSSPSQEKRAFRHTTLLSDDSPAKPTRQPKRKASRNSKVKRGQESPEPKLEESPQKPKFKLHALDESDYLDDNDDKFADVYEYDDSVEEIDDVTADDPVDTATKCPMCHEVVDAELLAKYSDHGRMNIKKQTAFCRLHKRQTALSSRSQNGYPKINWETLDTRLKVHQDFLRDILEGTQQSHYRDILEENVESGKNRTLLKTEDSLTPGYYGPRGLRAMTEYIMRTLSSVVRKRAIEDRLVSARGYTGYVQAVLVPELTTRLIMEDMDVPEKDARKIMQDSIEVGELLYEDVGDVIAGVSDEEEEHY
ncbi:hypothetical protein F5B19DRAFT_449436 [Rostrohypoxylon terebratum]|nr:hypothetical protein F5B19DRAFT_449436 [Rostrohypoxylon terebratum]